MAWQGKVEPGAAADVAGALYGMGCYEVSMGDTIGIGTPATVTAMLQADTVVSRTCFNSTAGWALASNASSASTISCKSVRVLHAYASLSSNPLASQASEICHVCPPHVRLSIAW